MQISSYHSTPFLHPNFSYLCFANFQNILLQKILFFLLFFTLPFLNKIGEAQNLVPNTSFEIDTSCLTVSGAICSGFAPPWNCANQGTADLFNICSPFWNSTVPTNGWGYQNPHVGSGMAGAALYTDGGSSIYCNYYYIEYLQVKLDQTKLPKQLQVDITTNQEWQLASKQFQWTFVNKK